METSTLPRLGELTQSQYRDHLSLDYCKWLGLLSDTHTPAAANQQFLERYPHSLGATLLKKTLDRYAMKAAVAPGTSTDPAWAAPLAAVKPMLDAFIAVARSASLLGRIPGLRPIPFNVKLPFEDTSASYSWVAEGAVKPVSKLAFSSALTLPPTKVQGIVVLTRELVRLATSGMESALRDTLIAGLVGFTDRQFLDPAVAAVAGKNPASVTNPTVAIASTGVYATDLQTLLAAFYTGRPSVQAPVLIVNAAHASAIRSMNGGGGVGVDVLVSEAALGNSIMLDPAGVFVADSGVEIDESDQAALQMDDAPTSPPTATTVQVSLWQQNLRGYRVERFVNWAAVTGAVKYLAG